MAEEGWSAQAYLESPSDSGQDWTQAIFALFLPIAVAVALVGFGAGWYMPHALKWLVLAGLGCGCCLLLAARAFQAGGNRFDALDGALTLAVAWATASLAWTPDRLAGLDALARFALLVVIAISVRHMADRTAVRNTALAIAVGALTIVAMDWLRVGTWGGYFNYNFETEALLLALPFVALLHRHFEAAWLRYLAWCLAAAIAGYLLFFNPSKIEFVVWSALGMFWTLAFVWRKSRIAALGAGVGIPAILVTLVVAGWDQPVLGFGHSFKISIYPRLELLLNTLAMWRDAPFAGYGIGGFNSLYSNYQESHLAVLPWDVNIGMFTAKDRFAGAAHNEFVQYLAAFGIVGAAIALCVAVLVAVRGGRDWRDDPVRLVGIAVVVSCAANALVEFPLQNPATALLATVGFGWLTHIHVGAEKCGASRMPRLVDFAIGLMLVAAVVPVAQGMKRFLAGNEAYSAAMANYNVRPDRAFAMNIAAVGAYPYDDVFRTQLFISLIRWEELAGSRVLSPAQAEQAFATSLSAGPSNALLLARLQYLYNSGQDVEKQDEVLRWRKHLTTHAGHTADVWLMEAFFAGKARDAAGLKQALDRFEAVYGSYMAPDKASQVAMLRALLPPEARR